MQSDYLDVLRNRVRMNPDSPLFVALAEELRRRGLFDEACAAMEAGLERKPELSVACLVLARWYMSRGMYDHAAHCLRRHLERRPGYSAGHKMLAEVYRQAGAPEKAAEEFGKAFVLDPDDQEVRDQLESLRRPLDISEEAGGDEGGSQGFADVSPPGEHRGLADVDTLIAAGRYKEALAAVEDILAADPRTRSIILKREQLLSWIAEAERVEARKTARLTEFLTSVKHHFSPSGSA